MNIEEIKVGEIYYFNNRQVFILEREGNTEFFRVVAWFNIDHDVTGGQWCTQCMIGGGDYKGSHTCDIADEVIETVMENISDQDVFWVAAKYLKGKPFEYEKNQKLLDEIQTNQSILAKHRAEIKALKDNIVELQANVKTEECNKEAILINKIAAEIQLELLKKDIEAKIEEAKRIGFVAIGSTNKNISSDRLIELFKAGIILNALESGGVDNWQWYEEAMKDIDDVEQMAVDEFINL